MASGSTVALVDPHEPDYHDARHEQDMRAALRMLRSATSIPAQVPPIRTFVTQAKGGHGVATKSDAEVLDVLAWMMVLGQVRVEEVHPEVLPLPSAPPPPVAQAAPPAKKEESQLTWVGIELIGEDDKPIPGAEYEIELADGRIERGTLDTDGQVTIQAIRKGTCKVRFPALDADSWEKV